MKKTVAVLCCLLLIFAFSGCSQSQEPVKTITKEQIENVVEEKKNLPEEKTEISSIPEKVEETEKPQFVTESLEIATDTRSLKMGGKNFVAEFTEETTSGLYGVKKRNVLVFENEDKTVRYEFDKETEELLWAKFSQKIDVSKKITEEKARKVADAFISDNCSKDKTHTFSGIKTIEASGYFVSYTKLNDDYNLDGVTIIVRFDGTVGQYLLGRSDMPNVKADYESIDKVVENRIKQDFGKNVEFAITGRSRVFEDKNDEFYVSYYVKILVNSEYVKYSYDITITILGEADKSVKITRKKMEHF